MKNILEEMLKMDDIEKAMCCTLKEATEDNHNNCPAECPIPPGTLLGLVYAKGIVAGVLSGLIYKGESWDNAVRKILNSLPKNYDEEAINILRR